jgi:hypothetical protein
MGKRKRCIDCGEEIGRRATRCHRCATRAKWQEPEYKDKVLATVRSPRFRGKQSETLKAVWENEAYRQQQAEARTCPEYRAGQSELAQLQWQDEEHRREQSRVRRALWQDEEHRVQPISVVDNSRSFGLDGYRHRWTFPD